VLIPEENVKDLQDIPDNVKSQLEIVPVRWIDKVLEVALERARRRCRKRVAAAAAAPAEAAPPAAGMFVPIEERFGSLSRFHERLAEVLKACL
jgi:ATP-dependent Lon protease